MAFFCKEQMPTGEWVPVVYYERPAKSSQGTNRERTELYEVNGQEFLGADLVSPNFGLLMERFCKDG